MFVYLIHALDNECMHIITASRASVLNTEPQVFEACYTVYIYILEQIALLYAFKSKQLHFTLQFAMLVCLYWVI